jgi:hypothetical protein
LSEGFSGPDDESTDVSTWGELEEIESTDVDCVNSWEISSSSLDEIVLVSVDDEGSLSYNVSGVSHLSVTLSDLS